MTPPRLAPLLIRASTLTSALGAGSFAHLQALRERRSGVRPMSWETVSDLPTCLGEVDGVDEQKLPEPLARFDCRNNRLAWLAMQQDGFMQQVRGAVERHGPARVGVFLGTSTSGILTTEQAYRRRDPATGALPANFDYRHTHNSFSLADFVRTGFGLQGPASVVSTACSSSAKVFGVAQRMIATGLIDAAVVGGVDSLCLTTLYGFNSLQLLSGQPCRPFDVERCGINIGEAAGFALVERLDGGQGSQPEPGDILLSGVGESSDAHHMSAPHPQGLGARQAMEQALTQAGLTPQDIGHVVLHGTSTPSNDAAESLAVEALFGLETPCSSIKGHTGHTLGAAGVLNALVGELALRHDFAPAGVGTQVVDPALRCRYLTENLPRPMRHVMSNAFGFGGSNCSLVLSKVMP